MRTILQKLVILVTDISKRKNSILPSIEEIVQQQPGASCSIQGEDILVDIESLSFSFTFSYFERFGWQAFLVPKTTMITEDFSHPIYDRLQSIATTYNEYLRIYERPEKVLFPI